MKQSWKKRRRRAGATSLWSKQMRVSAERTTPSAWGHVSMQKSYSRFDPSRILWLNGNEFASFTEKVEESEKEEVVWVWVWVSPRGLLRERSTGTTSAATIQRLMMQLRILVGFFRIFGAEKRGKRRGKEGRKLCQLLIGCCEVMCYKPRGALGLSIWSVLGFDPLFRRGYYWLLSILLLAPIIVRKYLSVLNFKFLHPFLFLLPRSPHLLSPISQPSLPFSSHSPSLSNQFLLLNQYFSLPHPSLSPSQLASEVGFFPLFLVQQNYNPIIYFFSTKNNGVVILLCY